MTRSAAWAASVLLSASLFAGCSQRMGGTPRPGTPQQISPLLPSGATVEQLLYADFTGDGTTEALVAARIPSGADGAALVAYVVTLREERAAVALRHPLAGEYWLPIQIGTAGRPGTVAAAFSALGDRGLVDVAIVQMRGDAPEVTLAQEALLNGRVRFVPEGVLASDGDTDRLFRWTGSTWEGQALPQQYLGALAPATRVIRYRIDPDRGPMLEGPAALRASVGERLILRRMDRGQPSRLRFSGDMASYVLGADGVITLLAPGEARILIENPADSTYAMTVTIEVVP